MAYYSLQNTSSLEIISLVEYDGSGSYSVPSGGFEFYDGVTISGINAILNSFTASEYSLKDDLDGILVGTLKSLDGGEIIGTLDLSGSMITTGSVNITGSLVLNDFDLGELTLGSKIKVEIFNNSTTYTIPSWAKKIKAYVVGAGGGGGGGAAGYMHDYRTNIEKPLSFASSNKFDSDAVGHEVVTGGSGGASGALVISDLIVNKHFTPGETIQITVGAGGIGGNGGSPLEDLNGLHTGIENEILNEFNVNKTFEYLDTSALYIEVDYYFFQPGTITHPCIIYDWAYIDDVRIQFGRNSDEYVEGTYFIYRQGATASQIIAFNSVFVNLNKQNYFYEIDSISSISNNLLGSRIKTNSPFYFNRNYITTKTIPYAFSGTLKLSELFGWYFPYDGEAGGISKIFIDSSKTTVTAVGGGGGTGGVSLGTHYPEIKRLEYVKDIDYSLGDYAVPGGGNRYGFGYSKGGDNVIKFNPNPGGYGVSMITETTTPSNQNLLYPDYMNRELSSIQNFKYKNTAPNIPLKYNDHLPSLSFPYGKDDQSLKSADSGVNILTVLNRNYEDAYVSSINFNTPLENNIPLPTGGGGGTGKNAFSVNTRDIQSLIDGKLPSIITNRFKTESNPNGLIPSTFFRDIAEKIVNRTMLGEGGKCIKLNSVTNQPEEFTELQYNRYGYELPIDYTQVPRTLFIGKGGKGGHVNINDYDTAIYGLEDYDIVDPIPTSLPENGGDFGGGGGGGAGTYNPSKARLKENPSFEIVKGQDGADGGDGVVVLVIYN